MNNKNYNNEVDISKLKKNKTLIIGLTIFCLIVIFLSILVFILINSKNESKLTLFAKEDLIEDYYIIDDYENNLVYENKIYVPKYMTKTIQSSTIATYLYTNENYSLQLVYNTYKTEKDLNANFIGGESYKKKNFYYFIDNGNNVKIYFKNDRGFYQTIEISIYSISFDENTYLIDSSYKNLLENLTTTKKKTSDYSIKEQDGYYVNYIKYNYYVNESNKKIIKAEYKVPAEKYGSNYDSKYKYQKLYLDESSISFYEGEITLDIASVKNQTRIRTFFSTINNLDIEKEALKDLQYSLNQTAFYNITKDMVKIEVGNLQHNNIDINFYKILSDNNNSYNERIYAYYPIQENIYYIVQICGGDNKKLDINMIKDFLPTNVEIK